MPKIIQTMPTSTRRGGSSKYDWATWFDGQAREFEQGTDFEATARTFVGAAYAAARRLEVTVKVVKVSDTTVAIQKVADGRPEPAAEEAGEGGEKPARRRKAAGDTRRRFRLHGLPRVDLVGDRGSFSLCCLVDLGGGRFVLGHRLRRHHHPAALHFGDAVFDTSPACGGIGAPLGVELRLWLGRLRHDRVSWVGRATAAPLRPGAPPGRTRSGPS